MRRLTSRGAIRPLVAVLVLATVAAVVLVTGGDRDEPSRTAAEICPDRNAGTPAGDAEVKPRIVLQPDVGSQTRALNLGNDRQPEFPSFAVKSDEALPSGLENRLALTADTFNRTGNETAESVTFPEPTFSALKTSGNRQRIRFTICLTPPKDLPAGTYTGLVTLDGPAGVEGATIPITVNAKTEWLFWAGFFVTLGFAFSVLFYKGASDRRAATIEKADVRSDAEKEEAERWGPAVQATRKDLGWWAPTLFAILATGGTLFALYDSNPAWGADGFSSVAALIGAGLAAVGAKAIFSPSR